MNKAIIIKIDDKRVKTAHPLRINDENRYLLPTVTRRYILEDRQGNIPTSKLSSSNDIRIRQSLRSLDYHHAHHWHGVDTRVQLSDHR